LTAFPEVAAEGLFVARFWPIVFVINLLIAVYLPGYVAVTTCILLVGNYYSFFVLPELNIYRYGTHNYVSVND